VHDGPEYDALAVLTLFLGRHGRTTGRLAHDAGGAGSAPVDRNETYSASPDLRAALGARAVPRLPQGGCRRRPSRAWGASRRRPGDAAGAGARTQGVFAGLYLQSSSFFHRVLDEQESGFERFNRITAFVDRRAARRVRPSTRCPV
jgi:enterochelin esterase family protein